MKKSFEFKNKQKKKTHADWKEIFPLKIKDNIYSINITKLMALAHTQSRGSILQ